MTETPWLSLIGIGEDGLAGLSEAAKQLLLDAEIVFGGARHLALVADLPLKATQSWPHPFAKAIDAVLANRGRPVAVLASGDPFHFGIGASLSKHLPPGEMVSLPAPSAFSLAASRLAWPLAEVSCLSLCGRPLESLAPHLQPGRRLLVLSADQDTPRLVADYLNERGFAASRLTLLEALGGRNEGRREGQAEDIDLAQSDPLNLLAIEVAASPDAQVVPLAAGLPDSWFETDGQLTKRTIRAITLSSLAPRAGQLLWDIGCGSGSVAIEWMLRHPANRAVGLERDSERLARSARNAAALGTPHLMLEQGEAPEALTRLPRPDAVFLGGGVSKAGVLEGCWDALPSRGRLVANAVTLESEAVLQKAYAEHGGELSRIAVEQAGPVGRMTAFRPAMTLTQWCGVKP